MKENFWNNLPRPIFALAPMEDVTDVAFREMFARYSGQVSNLYHPLDPSYTKRGETATSPHSSLRLGVHPSESNTSPLSLKREGFNSFVMFTEFVSTEGLMHEEGRKKLSIDLEYTKSQRPIVAQIWGADPEKFYRSAEYVASLGFDGIDINMGCPQQKEIQANACAALIREPKLAQEIIKATKKGAGGLPVSVKTRLGYSKVEEMENWLLNILEMEPVAVTLHARTKKEMSKVPAHWDKISEAVQIRDREKSTALILGNGDIKSMSEGLEKVKETGCDGIMIGRGAFGNPWIFKKFGGENPKGVFPFQRRAVGATASLFQGIDGHEVNSMAINTIDYQPTKVERLRVMVENAELFEWMLGGKKSFMIMRKHFKAYCSGFNGAAELRARLMETKDASETKLVVEEYLKGNRKYTNGTS